MEPLVLVLVLGVLAIICGLIHPANGFEERFRFASYYGDHMVLQAGPGSAVIWGYGAEGATVTVSVEGKDKHTAKVLDELAEASKFPDVRVFSAALEQSSTELRDLAKVALPWSIPSAKVLGAGNFTQFSAVCWLFGRYLYEKLQYPVGLVESCWGGTPVEAWSSRRVLHRCGLVEDTIRSRFEYVDRVMGPRFNSVLWNAMIHPLLNMTIKGAIWYQGEDNTNYNLDLYNCTFPAMIDDWRLSFHQGSAGQTSAVFPFGFVQICTDNQGSPSDAFPRLRWHQTADFGFAPNPRMKNTFMAVSVDLVDPGSPWGSIHPRYKQDVARRLILGARAVAYGEKGVSFQGPFPTKVELKGNIMIITYSQKITVTHFNKDVFEVCCSKKKTACDVSSSGWAPAPVFNVYSNIVFLTTDNCPDEVSGLRYAWKDWPWIWSVTLDPVKPGGPFTLTAEHLSQAGLTSLNLTDVLFGDVWLCGGQSNMEMTLSQVMNASEELAEASKFPDVRVFSAALEQSSTELRDLAKVALPWSIPSAKVLGAGNFTQFSAVCWLFGRYLYEKLQYPVGLVESCWGGTPVEAWSSHRVLHRCGLVEDTIRSRFEYVDRVMGPRFNSVLWNAMIHPLLNMTIKGAIWYQGEDNTNYNLDLYNCTFPAMIDDWRLSFHQGSAGQTSAVFPFGFVQICTDNQGSPSDAFPRLRWHQTADFGFAPNPRMKNTFMAVSVDLVDPGSPWGSIHPRYKQDVARRLILGARAVAYGEKGVSFQGPFPTKVELKGNIMIITYSQKITVTHFNKDVFEVCCSKKKTACDVSSSGWAPAPVFNVYSNIVFLTTDNCPDEVSGLRYAWKDWPCDWKACPIYSADRVLPAPPFVVGPQGSGRWTILE
ncbi:UNVERIFIED_CONTAM: hypothetical protein FKN15_033858 [Acipenser sinensis]